MIIGSLDWRRSTVSLLPCDFAFRHRPRRVRSRPVCFFLALTLVLGGCGARPRPVAEIVTRGGITFVVVEPQANYLRVYQDGEYPLQGVPDRQGLRAIAAGPDVEKRWLIAGDEISWSTIDTIAFAEPVGDISEDPSGDFCPGQPESIAATVRLKDGTTQQKHLIDTTDRGIEGKSERGAIVVPVREIAKLTMIADQSWPWAKGDDHLVRNDELPTLRITTTTGETREFSAPDTGTTHEKQYGHYSLQPPDRTPAGLPALIAGARIAIPWNALKQVDIGGGRTPEAGKIEAKLTARAVYADGRSEDVGVADGTLSTTANGGTSIQIRDIAHIELASKPGTR